ncbi:MAG TPA: 4Fe-4S dicluster domain-containing protein [Anaerolineae bacterium]|nr:4Fe-4S dicluster domain-containing protein [Anaerolineae bacterium]
MTEELVSIFIMGKRHVVPSGLTIMSAMEHAGYRLIRGAGCRGGFCGACATVYRVPGNYRLQVGLACQTVIEPEMHLAQIPFYPGHRADYSLDDLQPTFEAVVTTYPELLRCLSCGTCTKACPQDIDVKQYMAEAMRGDIAAVADRSFDCIMCGLCVSRCPAEEVQPNIAILCRRLYGKYLAPRAEHLAKRVLGIEEGMFDDDLASMKGLGEEELRRMYHERDIEPE